jgi:hypothetical protein
MLCEQSSQLWNSKWCRRDHNCASSLALGDDAYHGHVNFIERSQMSQRSTSYPIKMAALVIGQISVLAVLVWMSH